MGSVEKFLLTLLIALIPLIFYGKDSIKIYETSSINLLDYVSQETLTQPVNVTMVGVEFAGLVKEGGLAEAIEGLTKGLKSYSPESKIRVIFPKYNILNTEIEMEQKTYLDEFGKPFNVSFISQEGIDYYFIEHPYFILPSDRPSIYGGSEELQKLRFTVFSKLAACLIEEQLKNGEMSQSDIIHLHDWHVAGILLKLVNQDQNRWLMGKTPRIVFTFHNNNRSAQGRMFAGGSYNYDPVICGLQEAGIVRENANFFIECLKKADMVTTVSETFAKEAQTLSMGQGVSFAVREAAKVGKLVGIINGCNTQRWNPETDLQLQGYNYGPETPDILLQKRKIKEKLNEWVKENFPNCFLQLDRPIVSYIGRFDSSQKGLDKLDEAIQTTLKNGGQFICMGSMEDPKATKLLNRLEKKYTRGVLFIRDYKDPNGAFHYQKEVGSFVRAATDFLLVPSSFEPCGLVQFEGWLFGSLTIASKTGGLADTIISYDNDPVNFTGFHFLRDGERSQSVGAVIKKALYLWKNWSEQEKQQLISRLMKVGRKSGWTESASGLSSVQKYLLCYAAAQKNALARNDKNDFEAKYTELEWLPTVDKETKIEEEYLKLYYEDQLDSEVLEQYYLRLPIDKRVQVPIPYGKGINNHLYKSLGAHLVEGGVNFTVKAPGASKVEVNHIPLSVNDQGDWFAFVPGIGEGTPYHFIIDGQIKIDPFGLERMDINSVVVNSEKYKWKDSQWLEKRAQSSTAQLPMSIYEIHPNFWKKVSNYRDLAKPLTSYCQKLGFTHVELMGLLDHPCERSWGYQVTGYFAPNNRLGSVDDLKYLIDYLHQNQIGVILDWVPAHFARDDWALNHFDGDNLFQPWFAPLRRLLYDWGSEFFDYGKKFVREFLISSASYWIEEMHIDALRVDAVRCMLYSEDMASRLFLKDFNAVIHREYPGVITIAEDSSGTSDVTQAAYLKGLGFDKEWNICWVKNLVQYFSIDPAFRTKEYATLMESITGNFFHKMVLPLSHDECASGSRSFLNKVESLSLEDKYANVRSMISFMMCLPGKKLMFMGTEFGADNEWDQLIGKKQAVIDEKKNPKLMHMVAKFNELYRLHPAFSEYDDNAYDLEWIEKNDPNKRLCAYRRLSTQGKNLACFHNFSNEPILYTTTLSSNYQIAQEIINTDSLEFGGKGFSSELTSNNNSYTLNIPPLSTIIIEETNL